MPEHCMHPSCGQQQLFSFTGPNFLCHKSDSTGDSVSSEQGRKTLDTAGVMLYCTINSFVLDGKGNEEQKNSHLILKFKPFTILSSNMLLQSVKNWRPLVNMNCTSKLISGRMWMGLISSLANFRV